MNYSVKMIFFSLIPLNLKGKYPIYINRKDNKAAHGHRL